MNPTAYSTEDFLADESFQAFVFESDPAAVQFWQSWVVRHPAKEAEFKEAVAVLQLLVVGQRPPVSAALKREELAKFWQSVRQPAVLPSARPTLRTKRARQWFMASAAAVVLLLAGLRIWQQRVPATHWTQYATAAGQQQIALPDGSRVVLNANSTLRLASTWQPGQLREVWLTGEAYFNVRHTVPTRFQPVAAAPENVRFVVHAGSLDVAVLGTEFNVRHQAGKTKVVLATGQIQLSRRPPGRPVQHLLMKPGELVEYDEAAPQTLLAKRPVEAALYSAWANGHLDFDNTPVSEIIALLEDTYGLEITLNNTNLLQQRLTGSIPNHNLDVLLDSFGKSLDVKVRRQGNRVWFD